MAQFKVGDKVNYTLRSGACSPMSGTVTIVGQTLLGVTRDGNGQYDAVLQILAQHQVKAKTPAEEMGLKVGDEVEVTEFKEMRGLRGRVFLKRDDRSRSPLFVDEHGYTHYVTLSDIRKLPDGPKAGVKWTDAPVGATHYSLNTTHSSKWHKLDEEGKWSYANNDHVRTTSFFKYADQQYARPESLVAIPGVTVEFNPLMATLREVVALEADARQRQTTLDSLTREVARVNLEKQGKLAILTAAGFKVVDGKLEAVVKSKPVEDWKFGDQVRCITTKGAGMAELTVGKVYTVTNRFGSKTVRDDDGDRMKDCVDNGCFVWQSEGADLTTVPYRQWKRGDIIRNVRDEDRGHYDITIGKEYTLVADGVCEFLDNAGDRRHRSPSDYVLVARA